MRIRFSHTGLSLLLLFLVTGTLPAQPELGKAKEQLGNESYQLFTDRNIYNAGDLVQFSVIPLKVPGQSGEMLLSRVYYVDIVSEEGRIIASGKFPLDHSGAAGCLKLPENISPGSCLLRGYTRWMMNFSASEFHYSPLLLINPERPLPEKALDVKNNFSRSRSLDLLQLRLAKHEFNRREPVEIEIDPAFLQDQEYPNPFVLSVVRKGTSFLDDYLLLPERMGGGMVNHEHLLIPETRGISLSGVTGSGTNHPSAARMIWLSVLDQEGELFATMADNRGRFHFQLPEGYGEREMYLTAENPELELHIDHDFHSPDLSSLLYEKLDSTNVSFLESLKGLYLYGQLENIYHVKGAGNMEKDAVIRSPESAFYGKAETSVILNTYIELPTLEAYFREVFSTAKIQHSGKERSLVIYDNNGHVLGPRPLILIDMIPVDLERVLGIHPELISRIDVINHQYIRGDAVFNGILSLFSKKSDFGGIEFKSNGLFFPYSLYAPQICEPDHSEQTPNTIPDLRTTLFWNGCLKIHKNETGRVRFTTGDIPGEYQIIIKTVDDHGAILRGIDDFIVK